MRPLLSVTREETVGYCRAWGLPFVTDSTNFSGEFSRNRVRLEALPVLRELNPRVVRAMGQTAELLSRDRDFLRGEAQKLLDRAERKYGLDAGTLLCAPGSPRAEALRLWLEGLGCRDLEKKHLDQVESCLERGGAASLPGGMVVRRGAGLLFRDVPAQGRPFSQGLKLPEGEERVPLPGGRVLVLEKKVLSGEESTQKIHKLDFKNALDYDIITGNLVARTRREGDRFSPAGRGVTKSLKEVFREAGIPPGRREDAVLLECGGRLAFCEGAGASEEFRVREGTSAALLVDVREIEEQGNEGEKDDGTQ